MRNSRGSVLLLSAVFFVAGGILLLRGRESVGLQSERPIVSPEPGAGRISPAPALPAGAVPAADGEGQEGGIRRIFFESLEGYAAWSREGHHGPLRRFQAEEWSHLVQARLLSRAWPAETFALAAAVASDATKPLEERTFAIQVLGMLAARGHPEADGALFRIAGSSDAPASEWALAQLAQADAAGLHRDLYIRRCREGVPVAFEAVGPWVDAALAGSWRETVARAEADQAPESSSAISARLALEKADVLLSSDWRTRVERILQDPAWEGGQWTSWALAVCRARAPELLGDALRKRLDLGIQRALLRHSEGADRERDLGAAPLSFDEKVATQPRLEGVVDLFFDDVLVAQAQAGGALTPLETRRLTTFGYLGDPRSALAHHRP